MVYGGIRAVYGGIRWYTGGIRWYTGSSLDGIRLVYGWYTIGIRLVKGPIFFLMNLRLHNFFEPKAP